MRADVSDDGIRLTRHKTSAQMGPKIIEVHDALRLVLLDAKRTATELANTQPSVGLRNALLASPFVFPSVSRSCMGGRVGRIIDDTWAEVRHRVSLPRTMTIHGLRGAFITQAQRLGVPLATVAAMVGHESPLTTLRHYSAPTRGEVAESAHRVATWIGERVDTRSHAAQPYVHSDSQETPTGPRGVR
jgi:integrase